MRRAWVVAVLLWPQPALAQAERYELGRRLTAFEAAWERVPDPAARERALADLPQVTTQFFSFRFGDAGRALDLAAHALASETPPATEVRWLRSLFANPESRLLDGHAKELSVEVKPFYPTDGPVPKGLTVRLRVGTGEVAVATPEKFPVALKVPLPPLAGRGADDELELTAVAGGRTVRSAVLVSRVAGRNGRVADLQKALAARPKFETIEEATVRDRGRQLADLAEGAVPETNVPAARLLAEAEAMLDGKPFFTPQKAGQFWLSVPLGDRKTAPLRVFVPKGLDAGKPVPVVFALHGAGGSENLFFEGYGAGRIVAECETRGWFLVATRSGLGFNAAPPVPEVFGRLAKRYPLDPKRVFVVGHSMGAGQAVQLVQKHPNFFAAAAALGGGGAVREKAAFATLPVFVGVGDKDFALAGARSLNKALTAAGAANATYKEYPGLEHLVIVREALPDAFAVFDKAAR
jgi:predicted esterase